MELYIFENYKSLYPGLKGSKLTDKLIKAALKEYGRKNLTILRTEKGKPYVKEANGRASAKNKTGRRSETSGAGAAQGGSLCISASHSGSYFVCLIGEVALGVDIQEERRAKIENISRRCFTDDEMEYLTENGEVGFFRLWTRKEAYCKYTGNGLADILKSISVLDRTDVDFFDFQPEKGIYCSCCIKKTKNEN